MASESGPYVKAALLCDQVLQERDNVLSAIRIVDRFTHTAAGHDTPDEMPPFTHTLFALAILVSGRTRGRHTVRFDMENPAGELKMLSQHDVQFEGEDRSVQIVAQIQAQFTHEGLHWLVVKFDGAELTRTPLRIVYQRVETAGPPEES